LKERELVNGFQHESSSSPGGSSGIGFAAATAFASEGAHVIITGRDGEALAPAEKVIGSSARANSRTASRRRSGGW
jgi:NAD(P)-dependent dehydrogenase (short-subunit alcohol dehydrogenase family)